MSDFKVTIKNIFNDADEQEVIYQFFWSEVREDTAESKYTDDVLRDFLYNLQKQGIVYKHEDNHGGEGEGEDYWSVYSFTKGGETVYIQFQGWYASYNGSDFTEWFFVEPQEVKVIRYSKVK